MEGRAGDSDRTTGIIVLAAGGSSRMGRPKQLLVYRGAPLVRSTVRAALRFGGPVVAVLGAAAATVRVAVEDLPIRIAVNEDWGSGMASSIRCGLLALLEESPGVDAVILALCDQPYVDEQVFARLACEARDGGYQVVAASYSGTLGVPALFTRRLFPELLELEGRAGAKAIIGRHRSDAGTISCPEAALDVDTPEAYERLLNALDPDEPDGT